MRGRSLQIMRPFGIAVAVDISWLIITFFVGASLATGFFPAFYPELPLHVYWIMGGVGAVALLASIVVHELAHAVVGRHYGLGVRKINLFVFGGAAEISEPPPTPQAELSIALAGPLVSGIVALAVGGAYYVGLRSNISASITGVLQYILLLNILLSVFNLLPALPLDGGRIYRAFLWKTNNDLVWATRIAATSGSIFSVMLLFFGLVFLLQGAVATAVWWIALGIFLRVCAAASYRQLILAATLATEQTQKLMTAHPLYLDPETSVEQTISEYIDKRHLKIIPVVSDDHLLGFVTRERLQAVAPEQRQQCTLRQVMSCCSDENTISPDSNAGKLLTRMQMTHRTRWLVASEDHLLGVVTLKDLLRFLARKMQSGAAR